MYQVLKGVSSKELLIVLPMFITALLMSGCETLDIDEYNNVEESASAAYIGAGRDTRSYSNQTDNSSLDDYNQGGFNQSVDEFYENQSRRQDELYESMRNSRERVLGSGSSGGNSNSGGNGDCFDGKTARQVIAGGGSVCR